MNKINLSMSAGLILFTSVSIAGDNVSQQIQLLNSQIQAQLQTMQAEQQKQLVDLNKRLQEQMKTMQTTLDGKINQMNTQVQTQMKTLESGLKTEIQQVQRGKSN